MSGVLKDGWGGEGREGKRERGVEREGREVNR